MQNRKALFLSGRRAAFSDGASFFSRGAAFHPSGGAAFVICCVLFFSCARRPSAPAARIEWMSLEQAAGNLEKEKRPVLIDLYTDWCGWCKQMDKKTYSNRQVGQYIREKFYPVKLDAESRAAITWNGRSYSFDPGSGTNLFAVYLTHGKLEFPTTIIIPPGEEPQAIPGYMEPAELELLVKYFGDGSYHTLSFMDYQKSFKASW